MRRKREPESDQLRRERLDKDTRDRNERLSAEDRALDIAIRDSIRLHGA